MECAKAPNNDTREFLPTAAEIRAKAKISNIPSLRPDVIASRKKKAQTRARK